ncbi:hypothetical protein DVB69_07510 [Sporosarcina sp. BI001-red]|uniref:hypothetical protein n=1 Tax=Sporosarcina sp. BI001-red TaxID=2282866 RepID=UPI000E22F800|nr:hypothetical protein [Sporosarcina sp. BI001-red]REB07830.1 hypothetical protein DVB69_07510 [Sporosarcina sp. BI001-red]
MKRIGVAIILLVATLLLSGCFGGKSITLTQRLLTDDEQRLIYSAGGMDALHFTSKDTLAEGKSIQFTIEQYEHGEYVGTLAEIPWNGSSDQQAPLIGFGVEQTEEQAIEQILFSSPGGRLQPELEGIPGGSTLMPAFESELTLKQGEVAYLAYYIVSASGRVQTFNMSDEKSLEQLQAYDRCLLLKAEWTE